MVKKKLIFVILDGMADSPDGNLLDSSFTPNLDKLVEIGKTGLVDTVPYKKTTIQSHEAILSLFGTDTSKHYFQRGPIEAFGSGLIKKNDQNYLAMRINYVTLERQNTFWNSTVKDQRAGRTLTSKEARALTEFIRKTLSATKFQIRHVMEHRGVLVFKGKKFENITDTDPFYSGKGRQPLLSKGKYSEILNSFSEKCFEIMYSHEVNKSRIKKGLMPADGIIAREAGTKLPSFKIKGKWAAVVGMPLEIGIAKSLGMKPLVFKYPEITAKSVKNLYGLHFQKTLAKTSTISKNTVKNNWNKFNDFWVHLKEFDIAGHDGLIEEKKKMIETVDRNFFGYALDIVKNNKAVVVVTSDHATPCSMKAHSNDPVPLIISGAGTDKTSRFSELSFSHGDLGLIKGPELMKTIWAMNQRG